LRNFSKMIMKDLKQLIWIKMANLLTMNIINFLLMDLDA